MKTDQKGINKYRSLMLTCIQLRGGAAGTGEGGLKIYPFLGLVLGSGSE